MRVFQYILIVIFWWFALFPIFADAQDMLVTKPNYEGLPNGKQGIFVEKPLDLLPDGVLDNDYSVKVRIGSYDAKSDVMMLILLDTGYNLPVLLEFSRQPNGLFGAVSGTQQTLWSNNAIHEIAEAIDFAGYKFVPEKKSVLVFKVIPDKGYLYASGIGTVTTPDKEKITLGTDSRTEIILGHPAKQRRSVDSVPLTDPGAATITTSPNSAMKR